MDLTNLSPFILCIDILLFLITKTISEISEYNNKQCIQSTPYVYNALHTSFYFKMLIFSHFDIFEVDDVS